MVALLVRFQLCNLIIKYNLILCFNHANTLAGSASFFTARAFAPLRFLCLLSCATCGERVKGKRKREKDRERERERERNYENGGCSLPVYVQLYKSLD
jgi:hypothetical protein